MNLQLLILLILISAIAIFQLIVFYRFSIRIKRNLVDLQQENKTLADALITKYQETGSLIQNLVSDNQDNYQKIAEKLASFNTTCVVTTLPDLSFYEAFHHQRLLTEIRKSSLKKLNREIEKQFADNCTGDSQFVESVYIEKDNKIVWQLSRVGIKLLKIEQTELVFQKTAGKLLPAIRDSKTKQVLRQIKGDTVKNIGKLSKLGNLIINTAHLISAADLAKNIKILDQKLNFLIEGRKIDKLAKLESNFRLTQQILSDGIITAAEKNTLLGIHKELMELRSIWRHEIEYKLLNIQDPKNKSYFVKKLTRTRTIDEKIYYQVTDFELEMILVDFSILFDILLCDSVDLGFSIEEDLEALKKTKELLQTKIEYLSGEHNQYNLDHYLSYFENFQKKYQNFSSTHQLHEPVPFADCEMIEAANG